MAGHDTGRRNSARPFVIPNDVFFSQVIESLGEGNPVTFTVKGYSMYPFMRNEKDRVCIEKYDGGRLNVGDVILFCYRGKYILHRIYGVAESPDGAVSYRTVGDGNISGYETAVPRNIAGIMTKRITPSGREWGCGSFSWKCLSMLWMSLYGVRRWCLAVLRRIYR